MAVNSFLSYFKKPVFLSTIICAFVFYSGIFLLPVKPEIFSLVEKSGITRASGKLLSSPAKASNGSYYSAYFSLSSVSDKKDFSSSAKGRIKIYIPSELVEAYYPGKLFSLSKGNRFLYETGGLYSFSGKYSDKGFYVKTCDSGDWEKNIRGRLSKFRALCRLHFKRLMYGWGRGGGLLLALLCGSREYTDPSTQDNFRRAGLSHILALSGMHLSMFSAIAIFFGNRAGVKKLTFVLRIITLVAFVWFAGFSPSLTRAFICALLMLVSTIAGALKPDMLSILCFSFLLQSAICPQDIHETAFILSYGALAGILIFNRFFYRIYTKLFPRSFSSSLSAATAAQTFTAPISLNIFGSFSPIGIISATVVSPFVTLFIYCGLSLILLSLIFPIISKPSEFIINLQYNFINYIVKIFSQVPNFSL